MTAKIAEPAQHFWSFVEKRDGCWLWQRRCDAKGYGRHRFDNREQRSHRVAWILARGAIPDGLHVLHHCDVPACCNPDHLFLGTNDDNVADKCNKGRQGYGVSLGEAHGMSKLTADDVRWIRSETGRGVLQKVVAFKLGITQQTVSDIVTGRRWAWLR